MDSSTPYKSTATTRLFDKFNTILYIAGYKKFWVQEVDLPTNFKKIYDPLNIILHVLCITFSILEFGSLFTQSGLTPKQQSDRFIIAISNCFTHVYSIKYFLYKKETRQVFYYLVVVLKEYYSDPVIEKNMIKKLKAYLIAYAVFSVLMLGFYGLYSIIQVMTSNASFITVITMWPDVHDKSKIAEGARVIFYLFWWISFYRISAVFLLILPMLIGLAHQYMNLQSYFYSLENIFELKGIRPKEKEEKYEKAFVFGIKMHADTIWCTNQCQMICSEIFASHVLQATGVLIFLLPGMTNARNDMETACSYIPMFMITLVIMGYFMWNAGDIIVEAAKLPEAMYSSGWDNCYGESSMRVRKLVVIAMTEAQRPIVLTALGVVELSYETYLAMIKTAYSVFSVFY